MREQIVRLTAVDFEDAMDFLNMVFGTHRPHDFENLLPAIYQPTDAWMACNYAIRKDGKIRGIVGMFPMVWQVGDTVLKVAGIGGVSTHPKSRGAGYMKTLMHHCVGLMREQGYHLSYLGGQRQRYRYFGYERCGCVSTFSLNKANLRHGFEGDPGIHFEPLLRQDTERLTRARTLHETLAMHCVRAPENFHNHLRNWHNRPFAALDREGLMVGYLVANDRGDHVSELVAVDDGTAMLILRAWVAEHCADGASVELPSTRSALIRLLGKYCERTGINNSGNWQVFDWIGALDALLKARLLGEKLIEGTVVVGIERQGALKLRVEGERAYCTETTDEPDLQCDAFTAMRLLFGPLPPSQVLDLPARAALLEQWCPLPLHWAAQDGV